MSEEHTFILDPAAEAEILRVAAEGHPYEVCGLLLGVVDGRETRVLRHFPARNLNTERAHDRYELDPADFLAADQAARKNDLDIVGIWHTHPDHPAIPSQTDLEAAWEGYSYLILSVAAEGVQDLRSWRLVDGRFEEESVPHSSFPNPLSQQ